LLSPSSESPSALTMFSPRVVLRAAAVARVRGAATVAILDTAHPGDVSQLSAWLASHPRATPRCVLGKTEGNGCVNDFTRGYASHVVHEALGERRGDSSIIMSGGTEGVLCPHLLLFADDGADAAAGCDGPPGRSGGDGLGPRLSLGVGRTRPLAPHEIGRRAQVEATRDAVLAACADAGLEPADVCFAQVKCPLLTPERVRASAEPCATEDGYHSMGLSRGASSLGVALATGELSAEALEGIDVRVCTDLGLGSSVASASAGIELMHGEVFVLGNSVRSGSALRAACGVMRDAIDAPAVLRVVGEAGLETEGGQLTPAARGRVRAVLAKADGVSEVRGHRTTMCADSDLHATRHARAAVGGLLAGVFGHGRLYVSGGAEHQGPEGGGPVCVVYEV